MKKIIGWMTTLALALTLPFFTGAAVAAGTGSKAEKAKTGEESSGSTSKDEADKLKEHNKLRSQISKMKYPATKAEVVAKVKGMKPDDRKWFTETLPEKTYNSADEVFEALGWPTGAEAPPSK